MRLKPMVSLSWTAWRHSLQEKREEPLFRKGRAFPLCAAAKPLALTSIEFDSPHDSVRAYLVFKFSQEIKDAANEFRLTVARLCNSLTFTSERQSALSSSSGF